MLIEDSLEMQSHFSLKTASFSRGGASSGSTQWASLSRNNGKCCRTIGGEGEGEGEPEEMAHFVDDTFRAHLRSFESDSISFWALLQIEHESPSKAIEFRRTKLTSLNVTNETCFPFES